MEISKKQGGKASPVIVRADNVNPDMAQTICGGTAAIPDAAAATGGEGR